MMMTMMMTMMMRMDDNDDAMKERNLLYPKNQ